MNEVEVVNLLHKIQFGGLKKVEEDKIRLLLKKAAIEYMRHGGHMPLSLGWHLALMLEDPEPKKNLFLLVKDKTHLPANRTKGTFAVAWSYDYLSQLTEQELKDDFKGHTNINYILESAFSIKRHHIEEAIDTYGELVRLLNNKEFNPHSVNAPFLQYAISYIYVPEGVEDSDLYFEAILEDGTLLQGLRDGNFRALSPKKAGQSERTIKYHSYSREIPAKKHRRITLHDL